LRDQADGSDIEKLHRTRKGEYKEHAKNENKELARERQNKSKSEIERKMERKMYKREREQEKDRGPRTRVWMEDNSTSMMRMFSRIVVIWIVWPSYTAVCSIFDPFSTAIPKQETSSTHTRQRKLAQTSTH